MEKTVSELEAQRNFGGILQEVAANGDNIVVEQHGKPVAVVVPVHVYEQWQRSRTRFFERVREAAARANMSPEDAEALAQEAVATVRKRRHE